MARFDVFQLRSQSRLVLDCQADVLSQLSTRLVVPLVPENEVGRPIARLNPILPVNGELHVMRTQYAAAIEKRELGSVVASLAEHETKIGNALDLLLTGI